MMTQNIKTFYCSDIKSELKGFHKLIKWVKFAWMQGFLSVVEIGQCFMTKDNEEQFHAMACREYTLPRIDGSSQRRGWIHNQKP